MIQDQGELESVPEDHAVCEQRLLPLSCHYTTAQYNCYDGNKLRTLSY